MYRKFLLCVCGTTPQIITETLYALSVKRYPPFIPDEIIVITTFIGKELIKEKLLNPMYGKFFDLIKEYNLPKPLFNENNIYVIQHNGNPIEDIVDEEQNKSTGNFIMNLVKDICIPEENCVHASIAGGRKTMGMFLGMAMQFFAKKYDEMSHVLVSPPFENHPEFYYPTNPPKTLTIFDFQKNKYVSISTDKAQIYLAMIPFIKLRDIYLKDIDISEFEFSKHVHSIQKIIKCPIPSIKIDYNNMDVYINSNLLNLTKLEKAIYIYFLLNKLECCNTECIDNCHKCYISSYEVDPTKIVKLYQKINRGMSLKIISFEENIKKRNIMEWFLQHKSRINKKIRQIDPTGLCTITSYGTYGNKIYGIALPKQRIIKYKDSI